PLSLFTNGVWLHGKQFWAGNMRKAAVLLALKLLVLPALQLACAWVVGLSTPLCGTLLLLAVCPPASTAFVISSHYGHGTELVTLLMVVQTVLLVPIVLAALALPEALGLFTFQVVAPGSAQA
ncbi:hypothetical protein QJQ45_028653, partial [Haematococcus lacustris]